MDNPFTLPRTEAAKLLALLTDLEANWAVANPPAPPAGVTTGTPSNIPPESHTGTNPRRDWAR